LSSTPNTEDTIVAIASPPGQSARGIVRLSGPDTLQCVASSFAPDSDDGDDQVESATRTCSIDGYLALDQLRIPGRCMLWPSEKSFTRQPSAEFHTIGSTPILQMAVKLFCQRGARMAEPGEFTMRAFLSGRIDLTQAEAVLAVIDSQNRSQLNVALGQLAGGLAGELDLLRNQLMSALAELEAGLDFVEEDIEFISNDEMIRQLEAAQTTLKNLLSQIDARDISQSLFRVGLFGLPNAGKSSLFNTLLGREHAIVTDLAGTTTDKVTAMCHANGVEYELADTAGFETSVESGSISNASQEQREDETKRCDLAILCVDVLQFLNTGLSDWHLGQLARSEAPWIVVLTKSDQANESEKAQKLLQAISGHDDLSKVCTIVTSSINRDGIGELESQIADSCINSQTEESSIVGSTVVRTGECLRDSLSAIESALVAAKGNLGDEIVASEVRSSLDSIGQIVGKVYTDDILGLVFGRFCIGK
jgi:tRNA modification GTPase